jgi:hypothetical protein
LTEQETLQPDTEETVKAKRILIKKGERAAIAIRKPNAGKCDGKNTGGYTDLVLIGPASICLVISKSADTESKVQL